MRRRITLLLLSVTLVGCRDGGTALVQAIQHEAFEGQWRSVTPQLEFVRLTVHSKSSEQGALAGRLTFSGVYWEGSGRISGDSLVLDMTIAGNPSATGRVVARIREGDTLVAVLRSEPPADRTITFVRGE